MRFYDATRCRCRGGGWTGGGVSVPKEWFCYPYQRAWGLKKPTGGSLNWHFRVLGIRGNLGTQLAERLESMQPQPQLFQNPWELQRQVEDLVDALQHQRSRAGRQNLVRLTQMSAELKELRERTKQTPPPTSEELANKLAKWRQVVEQLLQGDQSQQLALALSSANRFLRFDPAKLEVEPVTVGAYSGHLVTVPDNSPKMKYAFIDWTDQQTVVFEFFDNEKAGTFGHVKAILESAELALERQEVGNLSFLPPLRKEGIARTLGFLFLFMTTALPAGVAALKAYRVAQEKGQLGKESSNIIARAVSRTLAVVSVLLLCLGVVGILYDASRGTGSFWMVLIFLIPGAFIAIVVWVVGLLAGYAGAYAGRFTYSLGRAPYTLAVMLGTLGAAFAAGVVGFFVREFL